MTAGQRAGGRRSASRRGGVNVTAVLALVLPLLTVVALVAVRSDEPPAHDHAPARTALTSATLVCPAAFAGAPAVSIAGAAGIPAGSVEVGLGEKTTSSGVRAGRVSDVDDPAATAVSASGDTAPGLVAGRGGGATPAMTSCRPPSADQWFTGVAAGANRRSVLELTNPDSGTAVADVVVLGRDGVVEAPRLRGVSVPGGTSVRLDLGDIVPREDELALHVTTARGRVGASVLDKRDPVGPRPGSQDWLPAQSAPATSLQLLGAAPGTGARRLTIANPGTDEVRARIQVVGKDSVFAPEGVDEVRVPPQSVATVSVAGVVDDAVAAGGLGLEVTASGPVTATLRSVVAQDLSFAAPADAVAGAAATVLLPAVTPTGRQAPDHRLLVAGATRAGSVTVVARAADGRQLRSTEIDVVPGRGLSVDLPRGTRLLTVTPERTSVHGAVVTSGRTGAAVLPLTVPLTNGLVPDVRPGLP